ncbi:hypothetical protein I5907_15755 [Panacibacter sp. DH6]|uniref:Uncharacterized protein n=1 Tax=Panacibacter microcysteis TaxID=2793269 RepID=A0A931GYT6_9BACT|nr:hypothetical protein [Panacibacter microcysteis]MBG9377697.1 hypothetical protein [Panacibacter microcysteis]
MSYYELKEKVQKANTFDRYMWYVLFSFFSIFGIWLFYKLSFDIKKFQEHRTSSYMYFLCTSICAFSLYSIIYLIPNRYKVLSIYSELNIEQKQEIVKKVLENMKIPVYDNTATYYYYEYGKSLLSWGYNLHLAIDIHGFYLSIQGRTGNGRYGGGFIDLGGTEKQRRKIINQIKLFETAE